MRQELEFGEARASSGGRYFSASATRLLRAGGPYRTAEGSSRECGDGIEGPPITNDPSLIMAFLIDTLPIRIARKSCASFIGACSNRHSSEPLSLHQNCAALVSSKRKIDSSNSPRIASRNGHHARIARMAANAATIATNLAHLRERVERASTRAAVQSGRALADAKIVAISKTFSAAAIRSAYDAGLRDFGENRVQEWESKRVQLAGLADMGATWHMIGHVQSNKAARVAQLFDRVDSLDSLSLAKKLDFGAAAEKKRLPVLIEVHLSDEASKSGASEAELDALAEGTSSLAHLDLQGLMTIPPYFDDAELVRPYFRRLRDLRDALSAKLGRPLSVLSMGMSHDFEIAIEEGATEVRIGTAIFGAREQKP